LADPEELTNLATDTNYKNVMIDLERELRQICDPEAMDALAKLDQKALIERLGGVEAASQMGAAGATPSPIAA
jgi:choline-sulfatase